MERNQLLQASVVMIHQCAIKNDSNSLSHIFSEIDYIQGPCNAHWAQWNKAKILKVNEN